MDGRVGAIRAALDKEGFADVALLLGLGLRVFSMNPIFIPRVKKALRAVDTRTVRRVVHQAINLASAQQIEEMIIEKLLVRHPDAFLQIGPSS